jgi:glucose/mannose-6-phosphate isomerase
MLDDLKYIHEKDVEDALGIAEKQADQLEYDLTIQGETKFSNVFNVVYAGMGGSALAAEIINTWPKVGEPFEIVRDYDIPQYVDADTLFIAASYSGNTEETLSAIEQAEAKGAQIVVIAGGGKLAEIAQQKGYLWITLPKAAQPRYAVLYNFKALLIILNKAGLVSDDHLNELPKAAAFLRETVKAWLPTVPGNNNQAKQIALECIGKSVVIYGGPKLYPAAYKWKISFNENAKQIAWTGHYPEFNHNEFLGWSQQPVDKPYTVIDLRGSLEHPRVTKRFEVSDRMLSGMRPASIVIDAKGETVLEQLLYCIAFGDFVTLYTALLNGINPAPVEMIEKFKKQLVE